MRGSHSKGFGSSAKDPTWVGIGSGVADIGGLVFVITLAVAGIASWKSKNGLGRAAGILAAIGLVGWLVTIWAMGAKPS